MVNIESDTPGDQARIGWWAFVLVLAAAAAFIAYSFVGMIALGVFGYYATRPIKRRIREVVDSNGIAAAATVLLVLLPIVVIVVYAGFQAFTQIQQVVGDGSGSQLLADYFGSLSDEQRERLTSAIQNPSEFITNPRQTLQTGLQAISGIVGGLLLVALAVTLSYFLLENDEELSEALVQLLGGRDTTSYAYATAVDEDLESVFFGNFLFVIAMAVIALAAYWGTNLLAPEGLRVPMIFVLAFLTGIASLVPIVVGKVVYLPVVGYLGLQAVGLGGSQLIFVGGVLVAYFLILDILPQTFLQPYITARQLDMVMMMFAYLLGPVLFGWYGFFLLPIVFILMLEAIRIVLPELVRGEPLTPTVSMGESVGSTPRPAGEEAAGDNGAEPGDDTAASGE